jgi:hypothetical protein
LSKIFMIRLKKQIGEYIVRQVRNRKDFVPIPQGLKGKNISV